MPAKFTKINENLNINGNIGVGASARTNSNIYVEGSVSTNLSGLTIQRIQTSVSPVNATLTNIDLGYTFSTIPNFVTSNGMQYIFVKSGSPIFIPIPINTPLSQIFNIVSSSLSSNGFSVTQTGFGTLSLTNTGIPGAAGNATTLQVVLQNPSFGFNPVSPSSPTNFSGGIDGQSAINTTSFNVRNDGLSTVNGTLQYIDGNQINGKVLTTTGTSGVAIWQTPSYTTGGTYNNNTGIATFNTTSGGSYTVSGFNNYWISGSSGNFSLKTRNDTSVNATGNYALAEGAGTLASGVASHAEGGATVASGDRSHAEGSGTIALSASSHSEGTATTASGIASHAEGYQTSTLGVGSHSEGKNTVANGNYSHAEGDSTQSSGTSSHAEGFNTFAQGIYSHAEGNGTNAGGVASHAEGGSLADGDYSHAEGLFSRSVGENSHVEGFQTTAIGNSSHAEGYNSTASTQNIIPSVSGASHAEGYRTKAYGDASHSEGYYTTASGMSSHSEGKYTTALGGAAHVQGLNNFANGQYSYAGGTNSLAMRPGEFSWSTGGFPTGFGGYSAATSQYMLFTMYAEVLSGSTELTLMAYGGTGNTLTLADYSAWNYKLDIIALDTFAGSGAGASKTWSIVGGIKRVGGVVSLIGSPVIILEQNDDAVVTSSWTISVSAVNDPTNHRLSIVASNGNQFTKVNFSAVVSISQIGLNNNTPYGFNYKSVEISTPDTGNFNF